MRLLMMVLAGLLLGMGCSDDSVVLPKYDKPIVNPDLPGKLPDGKIDSTAKDVGIKTEAKPVDKPGKSFMIIAAVGQSTGHMYWGPKKTGVNDVTVGGFNLFVNYMTGGPAGLGIPDFADPGAATQSPPYCTVFKYAGGPAKTTVADAGKITLTGYNVVPFLDPNSSAKTDAGTSVIKPLPATVECNRIAIPGTTNQFTYDCSGSISSPAVLVGGPWLTDTSKLTVNGLGGSEIPAFQVKDVGMAPQPLVLKSTTDLGQMDPANFKLEWEPNNSSNVSILIRADLKDKSAGAVIQCVALAVAGSFTVSSGAMAMLPKVTSDANPLLLTTMSSAWNPAGGGQDWGNVLVTAGRGAVGISCRNTTGACPP